MAKSTKFLTIIIIAVMLTLVVSMAVLSWGMGNAAFAVGDTETSVVCYIDSPTGSSGLLPPEEKDEYLYTTGIAIRFVKDGQVAATAVQSAGQLGTYVATGLQSGTRYNIEYSTDNGTTWQGSSATSDQIGGNTTKSLFFYTYQFEDIDGTDLGSKVFLYGMTDLVKQFPDAEDVRSGKLFRAWIYKADAYNIAQDCSPSHQANNPATIQTDRIDVDPTRFTVNQDNSITVYGSGSNFGISGKVPFTTTHEAISSIVTTYGYQPGDNVDDINISITMGVGVNIGMTCELGKGNYTISGTFNAGAINGAFAMIDPDTTLVLDGATIVASGSNGGIKLDKGTLVLQGDVNPGGIVLTDNSASPDTTLQIAADATLDDKIDLYYLGDQTVSKTLDRDADANTSILRVSGESSANFNLKNSNNSCGMKYNAATGTLDIAKKYAIAYQKMTGEVGTAPTTQYIVDGEDGMVADVGTLDKVGHQFVKWYEQNTDKYYQVGDIIPAMTADVTLRAVWELLVYPVKFEGTSLADTTHTYGTATIINTPTKTGFVLDYWLIDGVKTIPVNGKITLGATTYYQKPVQDILLEAVWHLAAPTGVACADYQGTYDGKPHQLSVTATHPIDNVLLLYKWYRDGQLIDQSSSELSVKNVADSGTYICTVQARALDTDTGEWATSKQVSVTGIVEITRILLSITADNQEKKAGAKDPALTYRLTAGGMAEGETLADLGARLARVEGEDKGRYEIRFFYTNGNYQVAYTSGFLTIKGINVLVIVLPSVFGGLALIGVVVVLILLFRNRKNRAKLVAAAEALEQALTAEQDPPKEGDA